MIEFIYLFSFVILYCISFPLSLYIGSVLENLKNYQYYHKKVILKKKNDDYDEPVDNQNNHKNNTKDNHTIENTTTNHDNIENSNTNNSKNNNNTIHPNDTINIHDDNDINLSKYGSLTLKNCFRYDNIDLKQPSKFYIYYTRFSLFFLFVLIILSLPKDFIPEISDVFTLKFWIPSKLSLKNSIMGFIITMIFGQPWLDNPIIQMNSALKCICFKNSPGCCLKKPSHPCSRKTSSPQENNSNFSCLKSNKSPYKEYRMWNPMLHFPHRKKAYLVDITRFFGSCFLIPVIEELLFRYIFYRFIIGGFNYKLVSFNTWKWTAAILSNITLTHIFYLRCYGKGEAWITGLVNGYLCTYSMVKQGCWRASVNTHSLINLYIGIYVLITKEYKYWY